MTELYIIAPRLRPKRCSECGAPIKNTAEASVIPVDGEPTPFLCDNPECDHKTFVGAELVATAIVLGRDPEGHICAALGKTKTPPSPGKLGHANGHTVYGHLTARAAALEAHQELGLDLEMLTAAGAAFIGEHINHIRGTHRFFWAIALPRSVTDHGLPDLRADGVEMEDAQWYRVDSLQDDDFVFACHFRHIRTAAARLF